jgi:hypothetical protein
MIIITTDVDKESPVTLAIKRARHTLNSDFAIDFTATDDDVLAFICAHFLRCEKKADESARSDALRVTGRYY